MSKSQAKTQVQKQKPSSTAHNHTVEEKDTKGARRQVELCFVCTLPIEKDPENKEDKRVIHRHMTFPEGVNSTRVETMLVTHQRCVKGIWLTAR